MPISLKRKHVSVRCISQLVPMETRIFMDLLIEACAAACTSEVSTLARKCEHLRKRASGDVGGEPVVHALLRSPVAIYAAANVRSSCNAVRACVCRIHRG